VAKRTKLIANAQAERMLASQWKLDKATKRGLENSI
jgi:hypothetical protein